MSVSKKELKKLFKPEHYKVELFKEKGFIRKQCPVCGKFYWTLNPDSETCGDTSCVGQYHFIGQKTLNWDLHESIKQLTDFFVKHDHTAIEPYPVVARWRDDLEFTIASIADFQPWVLNGVIDPPANPLVVPQVSIRFGGEFSDIDNIGRTGRHLTSFTMFGQHAFNKKGLKGGYWMDRCIDLNFKFLTENMKIKPEEINYVEDIWKGGGNFGPNLESMARGIEIVNSVFMQYELLGSSMNYKEMDVKTIDVGWGADRVAWFTTGTPTIYETVFGPVHEYALKQTGINVDYDLLTRYGKLSGVLEFSDGINIFQARKKIADLLGIELDELNKKLAEIEALYAINDHIRTFVFTTADAAIPSNVGGGYNLRVILRRAFSFNDTYGFNLDLTELAMRHIQYLKKTYPRVVEAEPTIPVLLKVERERYDKTLREGRKHVTRLLKKKKGISEKDLLEIYESKGIPPELVQEIAEQNNLHVDVPHDFYHKVTQKHNEQKHEKARKPEDDIPEELDVSTETRKLYREDQYMKETAAKIIAVHEKGYLVFDQTVFYPVGGGQASDHGVIIKGNTEYKVINVMTKKKAVVHQIEGKPTGLTPGDKVILRIDWERRSRLMRNHSAVHVVGAAARQVLGKHIWQVGADKTPERARLDISHWESLNRDTLDEIERIANRVVVENRPVYFHTLTRTEAEKRYGFQIYQGGAVPGKFLRIMEIKDFDVQACGGTHVSATGELGYIRILTAERIQDGVVRLILTAGMRSVEVIQEQMNTFHNAASVLRVQPERLPETVQRFFNEWKQQQKEITRLKHELAMALVPNLLNNAQDLKQHKFLSLSLEGSKDEAIKLAEELSKQGKNLIGIIISTDGASATVVGFKTSDIKDFPLSKYVRDVSKIVGGGAGGKGNIVIGGGPNINAIPKAMEQTEKLVLQYL